MLGNGRVEAQCFDGEKRLAHIRGKMRKKVRRANINISIMSINALCRACRSGSTKETLSFCHCGTSRMIRRTSSLNIPQMRPAVVRTACSLPRTSPDFIHSESIRRIAREC